MPSLVLVVCPDHVLTASLLLSQWQRRNSILWSLPGLQVWADIPCVLTSYLSKLILVTTGSMPREPVIR